MNEQYAGFWIRVGASIIDTIMLLLIIAIPLTMIYGWGYWIVITADTEGPIFRGVWDAFFNIIVPLGLVLWFWYRYGATPGKMIFGLKIVDAKTGQGMTTGQAVGRYFSYFPAMLIFGLGFIWVGFDKRKQGWHDKLAGTVVMRKNIA